MIAGPESGVSDVVAEAGTQEKDIRPRSGGNSGSASIPRRAVGAAAVEWTRKRTPSVICDIGGKSSHYHLHSPIPVEQEPPGPARPGSVCGLPGS